MIRSVTINDAVKIAEIYNYYIQNTTITFEEELVSEKEMKHRIESANSTLPWIVFEEKEDILGYANASEWKSRCAYKHSVESTVYLKQGEFRQRNWDTTLSRINQKNKAK